MKETCRQRFAYNSTNLHIYKQDAILEKCLSFTYPRRS